MAFTNRIRLPFKVSKPQFVEESEKYRKANGVIETLSVIIRKQYDGVTDLWPEKLHERFKIALAHDAVSIEGERYIGGISQEGDYQIEWPDFLDYPLGRATFKVNVTPFNASNSNCGTCEDFVQVVAEDDFIGDVTEGQTVEVNVLENDSICCYPVEISILTFDQNWLQSVVINEDNTLTLQFKTPLPTQNNVTLLLYRVQCENGQYDEASVIADVTGSEVVCLAPLSVSLSDIESDSVRVTVIPASPPPDAFEWELREGLTVIDSGTTSLNAFDIIGLTPSTIYTIYVRSVCGDGFSNYVSKQFTTAPDPDTADCGSYLIYYNDGTGIPGHNTYVEYIDCNGDTQFYLLYNMTSANICALQNSPGNPVNINGGPGVHLAYEGLC